ARFLTDLEPIDGSTVAGRVGLWQQLRTLTFEPKFARALTKRQQLRFREHNSPAMRRLSAELQASLETHQCATRQTRNGRRHSIADARLNAKRKPWPGRITRSI